ncbi:hypothetical protein A2160_00600 [Candidatus Beckwithbacteria bacterium RBG_13_42_9]|uniref:PPM-type phosphatase domain-containing protein n=1 Tax=Candidatus Beckwithbacteria bacterium RBG_13_42_9 TaxID=1797457 RepID=A0A1F5E4E1_9BACT|nr:MAG: hypothetical protein A2160_00600 [Candidatus Beckwithbacteria bacterium RBG_13_42_9]
MNSFEVGKIIGSANTKTWAQVHVFEPQDLHKKKKFGQLFAAISLESKITDEHSLIEIASFGREVLTRFHELYFSAEDLISCQERLEKALQALKDEFAQKLIIGGVVGVILETEEKVAIYVARLGQAQAYLWRQGQLVTLLSSAQQETIGTISGWLEVGDVVLLGSDKIFELVPLGSLRAALGSESLEAAFQVLAPMVHGHEHNALCALLAVKFSKEPETEEKVAANEIETTSKPQTERTILMSKPNLFSRIFGPLRQKIADGGISLSQHWQRKSSILVHQQEIPLKRSKKTAISVAVIFLLLLLLSIGLGFRKKQTVVTNNQETEILQTVNYNLDQAKQLENLNPGRARSLLTDAQTALKSYQETHPGGSEELNKASQELNDWLAKVSKEYKFSDANVFFDLSLINENFKAKKWGIVDEQLAILGQEAVATLDLESKQTQVIAGKEAAEKANFVAAVSPWAVTATSQDLIVVDKPGQRVLDTQSLEEAQVTDLIGYAGNIYVLDSKNNQIWRYAGLSDGLAKKNAYLKDKADLNQALSLTVDGSVWVLFGDGHIEKYTRGQRDGFAMTGLDKPFQEPIKIFTDENQNNLYILDRRNTRVVVFSKTGEYQAQYVWPGIAGVLDMVASEKDGKIFLLTGSKIYSLDIK